MRAFGIVTIIANQLHAQLGDLADYALTAISNRILLRTQEPDATLYARHYAASGVTAADISGQEPREHQYAWIGVDGRLTRLFSMHPLPWRTPLDVSAPTYDGPAWQTLLPPDSPTPAFNRAICTLIYGAQDAAHELAAALAAASDEQWSWFVQRWDAIRAYQRAAILAHPGCIPDREERQRWLARLRAARPRVLAMAEYARIRQSIQPGSTATEMRSERGRVETISRAIGANTTAGEARTTQQPHFAELDQRPIQRLERVEPDDLDDNLPVSARLSPDSEA